MTATCVCLEIAGNLQADESDHAFLLEVGVNLLPRLATLLELPVPPCSDGRTRRAARRSPEPGSGTGGACHGTALSGMHTVHCSWRR